MVQKRRYVESSDSDSDSLISSEDLPTPPPSKKKSKKHRHVSTRDIDNDEPKPKKVKTSEDLDEEYLAAARTMARCVDLFCKIEKVIRVGLLLEQDEAAERGELEEKEGDKDSRRKSIARLSTESRDRYKKDFDHLLQLAPGLRPLINDRSSNSKELSRIIQKMTTVISGTRSDDATRLKSHIGHYVAPHPSVSGISPPIIAGTSRAHLGVNHPVLAGFLCPITAVQSFMDDPVETRKKLENGKIRMTAADFPAFLWAGDPPASKVSDDDMTEGLFQGYFLERIMRHIFMGPSTALGEDSRATRSCNATLHDMTTVEAEHIAYACVQARFAISAKNKWAEADGDFNYRAFYYNIIDFIRGCEDQDWTDDLLKWWNKALFKNERGREGGSPSIPDHNSEAGLGAASTSVPMNGLAKMRAQIAARANATKAPPGAAPVIPNDKVDFPVPEAVGTIPQIPPVTPHDKSDFPTPQADDLGMPLLEIARPQAPTIPVPTAAQPRSPVPSELTDEDEDDNQVLANMSNRNRVPTKKVVRSSGRIRKGRAVEDSDDESHTAIHKSTTRSRRPPRQK